MMRMSKGCCPLVNTSWDYIDCLWCVETVRLSACLSVGCSSFSIASFGKPQLWRDAISQNAFDTSAGAGIFLVYATYMKRRHGVMKMGILAPLANNCIRLVSPIGESISTYASDTIRRCKCCIVIGSTS